MNRYWLLNVIDGSTLGPFTYLDAELVWIDLTDRPSWCIVKGIL